MNGHGVYVWAVYVTCTLVMTALVLLCYGERKRVKRRIQLLQQVEKSQMPAEKKSHD